MANGIEIARLYHSHIYVREITTAEDTILEMWWFLKGLAEFTERDFTLCSGAKGHLKMMGRNENWKWDWAILIVSYLTLYAGKVKQEGLPYQRRGSLQLWQFLLTLLDNPANAHLIVWTGRNMEFKLIDPEEVIHRPTKWLHFRRLLVKISNTLWMLNRK